MVNEMVQVNVSTVQLIAIIGAFIVQLIGVVVTVVVTIGKLSTQIAVYQRALEDTTKDVAELKASYVKLEQRHHGLRNWITIFALTHKVPPPEDATV